MRLIVISLVWWFYGTSVAPISSQDDWKCPEIAEQPVVECSCDMPHTLRCTGDKSAMEIIGRKLRTLKTASVSLLDCTIQNVTIISGPLLEGVALHGLVISSGEIREIHPAAFQRFGSPLQALGLPNNQLVNVPTSALISIPELDRLDLSGNKMKSLNQDSFRGLRNLSFIDLSNNILSKITPDAFNNLPQLKTLRLRGNRLFLPTITKIDPLPTIEELDLSENSLNGPLGPKTFSIMDSLRDLQLSHNTLSSIRMGALEGLANLTSLRLQHNQIDVIEDHAFSHTTQLIILDLAHNRIVAVSGSSLAHLNYLTDLDLRHNFLRALTADLILPLRSLKSLRLDDNDISIVSSDAFKPTTVLEHFTLSDNPLNCDCSLGDFNMWLRNSSLSEDDKSSAVCTTPPSLENGLLVEVPPNDLLCGNDEEDAMMAPLAAPFRAKINLKDFRFDGTDVKLQWSVEDEASPYTCDAIFVYEEEGPNEVLVESSPIKCNSSEMLDPKILNVTVPHAIQLRQRHMYRYCVVLLEAGQSDDVALILGCSDVLPLIQNVKIQQTTNYSVKLPKVISIEANLTSNGVLSININVYPQTRCELNVAVLQQSALLSQRQLSCDSPKYNFIGLNEESYRVCANIMKSGPIVDFNKSRCITVFRREVRGISQLDMVFLSLFLVLCLIVIVLVWGARKVWSRSKYETQRCFIAPECDEEVQHPGYTKFQPASKQATTEL
ncbi:uncharacterized protein [Leptinotarsa decemlineata]|uniref:uncharacterized protein n=1 Tax=Leptinotarsa decemlineata TaxID=7539 RepID=UPI003D30B3D1